MRLLYGDSVAQEVSGRIHGAVASLAALKTTPPNNRQHGMIVHVTADGSLWRFHSSSVLTGDDLLVATPAAGAGRWLRMPGEALLAAPIAFGTADAAILLTLQAGQLLQPIDFAWRITADFTGGASSAIGLSSSNKAGYTTKGDLLGGVAGDLAATLVASSGLAANGTIGAQWGTVALRRPLWKPTETVRFDRIVSAFTAGAGFALLNVNVLANDGA
jgi:hypothetical protein